ncbi:putative serine/threonine protein kinase [Actinoplanes missouriensis 431]|uniref:Putative serine/threonine protein kinase n=1 Tax=Actinoplanes missouriensis (strain ATCC 14538 / DSM 43046 / CBS 188.64 / JCM 3121 / NBRC 102363 / NCIMB 12654 / NRRL B-3342 / UNCC 431) TaxID=512565 RepID=I0HE09_ACTM4|nr:serine/threonine-protein kinase [Actinoplanes missouriensis]BAL91246.1 putative serine/threonine protein kinase [Actinoplanes missouriensis 431]
MLLNQVGDYRLFRRLGAGGMGDVYLGVSATADLAAVKMIHHHLLDDPSIKQRFASEIENLRTIFGSRVARLENADPYADPPWLATEFVPGLTLRQYVEQHGTLPLHLAAMVGAMLAEALDRVHETGLFHRDIKPQNIILGEHGPVLIDFGLAALTERDAAAAQTQTGMVVGTPAYMAPEQARGEKDLSKAVDVYGLGATLVFALAGHTLFPTTQGAILWVVGSGKQPPDLTGVAPEITSLVTEMIAHDPQARPDLRKVKKDLLQLAAGPGRSVIEVRAEVSRSTYHPTPIEVPPSLTDPSADPESDIESSTPTPPDPADATPRDEQPAALPAVDVTWLIEKLRRQYARRATW